MIESENKHERYFSGRMIWIAALAVVMAVTPLAGAGADDNPSTKKSADSFAETAGSVFAPLYGPLADYILTLFQCSSSDGIGLDVGGGAGNLVVELAKRAGSMRWIDVDINPEYFPHVARLARDVDVADRVGFLAADVQQMPFRDGYADFIVSRGSYPFWADKRTGFSEIYRVLKPGGAAFIGRGLPETLPVDVARSIRGRQNGGPKYDKHAEARELESIMKSLGIADFTIHMPEPAGASDVNYGLWLEIHKPGPDGNRTRRTVIASAPVEPVKRQDSTYYEFEPIDITGSRVRDIIAEPLTESAGLAASTTIVESREIEKQGAQTVIDALEYVPGAWVETRGRKVKQFFSMRGQKYPYPEYAVDGALFREFYEMPYFFSSAEIERIEILRSGAAMLSGLSGLTGIVNIVPKTYTSPQTTWEFAYGSFDSYRSRLSHGGKAGDVSYSFGIDVPHTDGPDKRNASENMSNVRAGLSWQITPTLSVKTNLFHIYGKRELTLARPPAAANLQQDYSRFDPIKTTIASMTMKYTPKETMSTDVTLFYANRDDRYVTEASTGTTSTREWDYEFGMNVVQAVALTDDNILRAGLYYNRWRAPYGKRFYVGRKCDLETFSGALVDEHRIGRLTLDGGVRLSKTYIHDYGGFNIDGSAKGFNKVAQITDEWEPADISASFGAAYYLTSNLSLHGNAVYGIVQPREGSLDTDGNEPENERRLMLDAGVKVTSSNVGEATITGFVTKQYDAIALSGTTQTVNGRIMELYLNRDQDQIGLEVDARSRRLFGVASLFLNTTAMSPRADVNGDMKLDKEKPRFITSGGVYAEYLRYDCNLFWKNVSSYESSRFGATTVPQPLGDFNTLNATAGVSMGKNGAARVYIEVMNIMDKRFSTVLGYPDFGRRWTAGVRRTF